jgi:hypothetical protein
VAFISKGTNFESGAESCWAPNEHQNKSVDTVADIDAQRAECERKETRDKGEKMSSAPKALANDPRMPNRVTVYEPKVDPDEMPADWLSLLSLVFGVILK